MASTTMVNASVAPAVRVAAPAARKSALAPAAFVGKTNEWAKKTVSNGIKTSAMMVWQPLNNKFFETFSYLPALTSAEIAKQVDYVTSNSWTPCLEFAPEEQAYVSSENCIRFGAVSSCYQDNRYWTMWKLPMFGCTDSSQVLAEIANCSKAFPDCYIRMVAFDASRQVQITGFLVQRPASVKDAQPVDKRSV